MKKIKNLSAFLMLFAAIGFSSCDSEPVDPALVNNNGDNGTGLVTFKVDFSGETFIASNVTAVMSNGMILISGEKGTGGEAVNLVIPAATTGTYTDALMTYDPTGDQEFQYANFNPILNENPDYTGAVTITSINTTNHTISGTFNFTGWWSDADANLPNIAFTNGSFQNIPYIGEGTSNPDPSDEEYYKAKVGGTQHDYSANMTTITSGGFYTFLGMDNNSSVSLIVKSDLAPGTYPITDEFLDDVNANYSNGTDSFNVASGTLKIISKEDGWIKGTFSFTATNTDDNTTIQITEGQFNIEL